MAVMKVEKNMGRAAHNSEAKTLKNCLRPILQDAHVCPFGKSRRA